jgi:hypothetical protein
MYDVSTLSILVKHYHSISYNNRKEKKLFYMYAKGVAVPCRQYKQAISPRLPLSTGQAVSKRSNFPL